MMLERPVLMPEWPRSDFPRGYRIRALFLKVLSGLAWRLGAGTPTFNTSLGPISVSGIIVDD
jgi:hypothetical protein